MRECRPMQYLEFTKITLTAYVLYKKRYFLLKAGKFSLGVKGRSVMSVIHAISVSYSKMKNNTMYLSVL